MKYFLASVANAELYEKVGGNLTLFASAHTLTDSSISFTSTMEEVRAGQGAKLYGRFNHDTGMTIALTDAMFNAEYIAAQIGAEEGTVSSIMYHDAGASLIDNDTLTTTKEISDMGVSCGLNAKIVYLTEVGCGADAEPQIYTVEPVAEQINRYTITGAHALIDPSKDYCISYFADLEGAKSYLVNAKFNPKELVLVMTADLFAGDAAHAASGTKVGTITVKVPRFQLDGAVDLSMAMSSAANISLNGTALATDSTNCESDGVYAEIVEYIAGRQEDVYAIVFPDGEIPYTDLKVNDVLTVYGITSKGKTVLMDNSKLTFAKTNGGNLAIAVGTGAITTAPTAAGSITATVTGTGMVATLTLVSPQ